LGTENPPRFRFSESGCGVGKNGRIFPWHPKSSTAFWSGANQNFVKRFETFGKHTSRLIKSTNITTN